MLAGRTVINLFFENSTRTRTSFEVAAKRLGADVINMDVATSSVRKGETLLDTAMTLNAMRPDAIVVRMNKAVNAALADAESAKRLQNAYIEPQPMSPDAFAQYIRNDLERWSRLAKARNIQLDS